MRGMSFTTTHYEKYPIYFDVYLKFFDQNGWQFSLNTLCKQNVGHYTFWTTKAIMALTKLRPFLLPVLVLTHNNNPLIDM